MKKLIITTSILFIIFLFYRHIKAKPKNNQSIDIDFDDLSRISGLPADFISKIYNYYAPINNKNFTYFAYLDAHKLSDSENAKIKYRKSFDSAQSSAENVALYLKWCYDRTDAYGGLSKLQETAAYYHFGRSAVRSGKINIQDVKSHLQRLGL